MNFGKNSTLKKRKALTSSASMLGKRAGFSAAKVLFLSIVTILLLCMCFGFGIIRGILDSTPDISDVNIMPSGYATFIYDANGNELQKLTGTSSNRTSVSIDKIPEDMQHAIVAIEDERFYEHQGIDARGILRALAKGVTNGFNFNEGASTLTQQLLKNNVFTNWTQEGKIERFKRKFQEQYLALQLESSLTRKGEDAKAVILENYLNTINLGAGTYGVQAASYRYFDKSVETLTLSECAVLAAIPQNPTRYNPITHPEDNAERREKVLNNMLTQGYITQSQYSEALTDNVYERIQMAEALQSEDEPYSYFIDELIDQVINDLQTQKGYTEVQAYNALYSGGLRIYTTQDPEIQAVCDEEYTNPDNFPAETQLGIDWALSVKKNNGETQHYSLEMMRLHFQDIDPDFELLFASEDDAKIYIEQYKATIIEPGETIIKERLSFSPQPQSSMSIMDQRTGYVKAIVGGRGKKTASLTLNRATKTYRQPGSTFKIVSTYAPALDQGETLATVYKDEPYNYANGKPVRNWLTNSYGGDTTIRKAIEQSVNVVAVKCFTEITPQVGFSYLLDFGFSNLVDSKEIYGQIRTDIGQATALGGITYGVTNLELTAAYAALANGGTYTKPVFYTQILDQEGNIVLENVPQTTTVTKASTAFLLTSAMEDVVTRGTGTRLQLDNMTVAGKTGTTSLYKDLWFVGFTPYYTCAVWAGYDNNEILKNDDAIYRTYQQTLWQKVMSRIHQGFTDVGFTVPDSVTEATICSRSGLLAGSGCPTMTEYFEKSTVPTERCTAHYVPPVRKPVETATPTPDADDSDNSTTDQSNSDDASQPTPETPADGNDTDTSDSPDDPGSEPE